MKKVLRILLIDFLMALLVINTMWLSWARAAPDTDSRNLPQQFPADLTKLSIEQLMNIEVVLVFKSKQKLSNSPSAVYVITNEDIRRSGATCIPEVLRMMPGLQVAKRDSNKWCSIEIF